MPRLSTQPRGSDMGHHTPSPLCPPPVPGWLTRHLMHLPAPPSMLPSSRLSPNRSGHLLQEGSRHRPSSHSPKMPANPGVEGEKEASIGGSGEPGVHSSCLKLSPPLGLGARAEFSGPQIRPPSVIARCGARWGTWGPCPTLLSRTVVPQGLLWPSYHRAPPPPTPSLVPALSSPCPSISEFWVFLGLS